MLNVPLFLVSHSFDKHIVSNFRGTRLGACLTTELSLCYNGSLLTYRSIYAGIRQLQASLLHAASLGLSVMQTKCQSHHISAKTRRIVIPLNLA